MKIKIGKKNINNGKTFFVAEMSANHNGSLKKAKEIIKKAKIAGADAIKLQTYSADSITLNSNKKDFRLTHKSASPWKKYKNFYQLYKKASTPLSWHNELFSFAKKNSLEIFSSPFDTNSVDFLENLGCVAYKIASPEITHIPLLERVAKTNKPIIISTGVAELNDIKLAIETVKKKGNNKIILLKCDSSYPAEIKNSNLPGIKYLSKKFKVLVGYSDHTKGSASAIASLMLGSCLIEKHLKLENSKSPDAFFSETPSSFKKIVDDIKSLEKVLKEKTYIISKESKNNFKAKRSIYVSKKVKPSEKVSSKNIRIVRPSFGLHPKFYSKIIGKKFNKSKESGERLKIKDII